MATVGKKLNYNDYKEGANIKSVEKTFVTKPESREGVNAPKSVAQAEKFVASLGSGK